MDKFNIRHTAAAIIIFFSVSLFFQLDKTEMQPWDEGLYAMRALTVNNYGNFWDQTPHAIGGLYSSTYPPLTIWIMAFNMKFMEPHVAVRLFSAICGAAAMLFIFLISRRFLSGEMSLVTIIALAVTLAWNKYSRQGMTDVPLMTMSIMALWTVIKLKEATTTAAGFLYAAIFMLAFAMGLMTKVIISFLPLLFVVMFIRKFDNTKKLLIILSSVLGLALAFPWHFYMAKTYGYEFYKVFFASHIYSSVENNSPLLGVFYYFNQLIITNPFLILALIFTAVFFYYRKRIMNWTDETGMTIIQTLIVWFGAGFVLLSLSMTKLPHYALYLILPGIILSAYFYEKADEDKFPASWKWWVLSAIIVTFFWSVSYELRQEFKELITLEAVTWKSLFLAGMILFLIIYGWRSTPEMKSKILNPAFASMSYFILIILVVRIIFISVLFYDGNISGGLAACYYLEKSDKSSFVYLYHEHNASDSLNPQLAWYSKGWTCNWRKGKSFHPMGMPKNKISFKTIFGSDKYFREYLVYYIPEDRELSDAVITELSQTRPIIQRTRNYMIFGPVMFNRRTGYTI